MKTAPPAGEGRGGEEGDGDAKMPCPVCGEMISRDIVALHYGGVCCLSCRAFFRRAHQVNVQQEQEFRLLKVQKKQHFIGGNKQGMGYEQSHNNECMQ